MFLKDDIYTTLGPLKLYHCWTDKVTKFDSSSFYNWEQDDMPIYDLEERTHYLWEQLGYPTSSVPAVALVVSADAPPSAVACNRNIFRSVSAAIQALPQVINFPIVIEVANFGRLGEIQINNHKFGPRGSLEIINRNFARNFSVMGGLDPVTKGLLDAASPHSKYQYVSGISGINYGGIIDYNPRKSFYESSCMSISAAVFSSINDTRLSAVNAGVNAVVKSPLAYSMSRSTLSITDYTTDNPYNSNSRILNLKAYEYNAPAFDGVIGYDSSTINKFNDSHLYYADSSYGNFTNVNDDVNGLFYGNSLYKISINNCDGPIFIRNFFLDGSGANANLNYGVEINNCPKIYLENIVSTRFRKAGLIFNNSNVTLLRGCIATRNYNYDRSNKRLTGLYNTRRESIEFNTVSSFLQDDDAAGLIANNSNVFVSSTSSLEFNYILDKIVDDFAKVSLPISRATAASVLRPYPHFYYMFEFSKNSNGMILNNSTLAGGSPEDLLITGGDSRLGAINISFECNTGFGLKCQNSQVLWDGRLYTFENLNGIQADSSILEVDKLLVGLNQQRGIDLLNSVFKYNRNKVKPTRQDEFDNHYLFSGNGQHLNLVNSKIIPFQASGMNNVYGTMRFVDPIGLFILDKGASIRAGLLPSVNLKNNSEAILVHPQFYRKYTNAWSEQSCRGSELSVTHGSIAILKGSKNDPTKIIGPEFREYQAKLAGVYAGSNSMIEFNGPTLIAQYGVDILAEDNSTINMGPHRDRANGNVDASSFNLADPGNHTAVELHSTRACIVVNRLSTFNAKDLGSFQYNWSKTQAGSSILNYKVDYDITNYGGIGIEPYVSAGSLQFYPNPNDQEDYDKFVGIQSVDTSPDGFTYDPIRNRLLYLSAFNIENDKSSFSGLTAGGMCVRALNNSIVNIHNVNFPCGWWNASAPIYDSSSADSNPLCSRLFIWNFADNSILRASQLSVSGLWPADSGYHGPSGEWGTSTLPANTPDTGAVAILDYFGRVKPDSYGFPVANVYGKTSQRNYGPFRLYFGVNPAVNCLTNTVKTTFGSPAQVYSQGYQFSSHLIVSGDDPGLVSAVSALYPMLQTSTIMIWDGFYRIKVDGSGYYYGKDMIGNPNVQAYLDQSAAETFANAKHCAVGKSNMAKKVQIHLPYNNSFIGESAGTEYKNNGRGLRSINTFDLEKNN